MFLVEPFNTQLINCEIDQLINKGVKSPKINLLKDKDNYLLTAELPGYTNEDIDISVEGNVITLSAKIKKEVVDSNKEKTYVRQEIFQESFQRTIELPHEINAEEVEAHLKNGFLDVKLPIVETQKPKKIEVAIK